MNYGAEYDKENFCKDTFFNTYKKFRDNRGMPSEEYKKWLRELFNKLKSKGVDKELNSNAIIYCRKPIFKDICFVAASFLNSPVDNVYMGLCDLVDIFDGYRTEKNMRISSEDVYYSNGDIKQPLMAIHVNYDGRPGFGPFVLYQCVTRRLENVKNSITWIFVYGDKSTLNDEYFNYLNKIRNDPYLKTVFKEIDMNDILGFSSVNTEMSIGSSDVVIDLYSR